MGRVIIADDDEIIADLVSDALISAGHAVGWLGDGKSALDVISRRPPDLLILDCNMPEMSGIELLREMRKSQKLWNIPVLMLTARQGESDERIVRYEGADDFISKPFDPLELVRRSELLMNGERKILS